MNKVKQWIKDVALKTLIWVNNAQLEQAIAKGEGIALGCDIRFMYDVAAGTVRDANESDLQLMIAKTLPDTLVPVWVDTKWLRRNTQTYVLDVTIGMVWTECGIPIFIMSDKMAALPVTLLNFWCGHEYGHVLQNDHCESFGAHELERLNYISLGQTMPAELGADAYAVSRVGKQCAIEALTQAVSFKIMPSGKTELRNRIAHIEQTF